jgi:hypothetical protein
MRDPALPDRSDAVNAFGSPRRPARWASLVGARWASLTVIAVVVAAWLLLIALAFPSGRALLHVGSPYPSCAAAGISTPEGREGVCARGAGLLDPVTLYNVVDRRHVLRMPEYQASLLGSQITHTHVPNAAENEDLYPEGHGQLVSFQVAITNTSDRPLQFGEGASYAPTAFYPSHPMIELALPQSPGSEADINFPAIINGRGAPTPSVFQQLPIAPHERLTGWVTFVAPAWSLSVLNSRPADVDFYRTNASNHYTGQIRLWK